VRIVELRLNVRAEVEGEPAADLIDDVDTARGTVQPDRAAVPGRRTERQVAVVLGGPPGDLAGVHHLDLPRSARGVVRGLHVRRGCGEAKLVRCSYGAIFDVIVDLRPTSPTYRNWESFELRDDDQVSLYVPAGCAHGFQALTDPADVSYRIDRAHDPAEDVTIPFDDPELAIPWPSP
jgi:dTDP-4-dehydrorhamnose 3,5-epimerase